MSVSQLDWATPASLTDFGLHFASCKSSAFRLEMLEYFSIPEEQQFFKTYLAGEKRPPDGFNRDWTDIVKKAAQRDAAFTRVRVVRSPYHAYLKFETAWGYSTNINAGEDIRAIDYGAVPFKTEVPVLKDYWLFDDSVCFLMEYDFIGRFLGVSRVHQQFVSSYLALKHELLRESEDIRKSALWSSV